MSSEDNLETFEDLLKNIQNKLNVNLNDFNKDQDSEKLVEILNSKSTKLKKKALKLLVNYELQNKMSDALKKKIDSLFEANDITSLCTKLTNCFKNDYVDFPNILTRIYRKTALKKYQSKKRKIDELENIMNANNQVLSQTRIFTGNKDYKNIKVITSTIEKVPELLSNKPTYEIFEAFQQIRHHVDYQNSEWKIVISISIGGNYRTISIEPSENYDKYRYSYQQVIIKDHEGDPWAYKDIANVLDDFKPDQYNSLDKRNKRMLINLRQQLILNSLTETKAKHINWEDATLKCNYTGNEIKIFDEKSINAAVALIAITHIAECVTPEDSFFQALNKGNTANIDKSGRLPGNDKLARAVLRTLIKENKPFYEGFHPKKCLDTMYFPARKGGKTIISSFNETVFKKVNHNFP